MSEVIISISLSAEKYLEYYRGYATGVIAYDTWGRRIQIPANILRPFVTSEGVHGRFKVSFNAENKFQSIERV